MKTLVFKFFVFSFFSFMFASVASAQRNISFNYDAAGNRTTRKLLAIGATCRQSAPKKDTLSSSFITLYPNPAKKSVNIEMVGVSDSTTAELELFDLSGKRLKFLKVSGLKTNLSLEGFAVGAYILKLKKDEKETVWKLIKCDE